MRKYNHIKIIIQKNLHFYNYVVLRDALLKRREADRGPLCHMGFAVIIEPFCTVRATVLKTNLHATLPSAPSQRPYLTQYFAICAITHGF